MAESKTSDAIADMRARFVLARDFVRERYDQARDDIKFVSVPGHQWDEKLKARRGDRPTYEFPKLRGQVRQVINEMRQSRPQGKVRGAEESDRALAELMQGICRNIESTSNADQAYDIAYQAAVQGGIGYWRICTDYATDDDFEQDLRVKPIRNPFAVKCDPAAVEIDRRDARFWFVEELIPRSDFERNYPDAALQDFDEDSSCEDWREADQIRIAEYWWKEPMQRELLALSDGRVVYRDEIKLDDAALQAAGLTVTASRKVDSHKVMMRLTNGHEWLTEPYEFPSKFIPIVPCWGEIQNIDGEDYFQGLVRPAKDQQRLHNVHKTAAIEAVAKAPKAPFILKMRWIKGLERFWNRANAEDYPYLPIADDAPDSAMPQRAQQAEVPAALLQLAAIDNDDMKAATGIYDASLGARSNETSGRAINARKLQGATANFDYIDNLAYAIRYTYEILVDMIPRVYDTPRVVRVLGADGGEKWKQLYQEVIDPATGQTVVLNDIRKGKYDVVVTVGPSFATQRMEAVDAFTTMLGQMGPGLPPPIATLMAYTAVKNMDVPGTEELDKAFRKLLLSQGLVEPQDGEQPPEPPQGPPPDPRAEAQARKLLADAELAAAKTEHTRVETQILMPKARADVAKTEADAEGQALRNMADGAQMAAALGPPSLPPPNLLSPMTEPPQGGFFMGGGDPYAG